MNDAIRTAILVFINSAFPVLQIAGLISFTGDQTAIIMSFIGNGMTLLGFLVKNGQQGSGTSSAVALVSTPVNSPPDQPGGH